MQALVSSQIVPMIKFIFAITLEKQLLPRQTTAATQLSGSNIWHSYIKDLSGLNKFYKYSAARL